MKIPSFSPDQPLSTHILLDGGGCSLHTQELLALIPATQVLLDGDAGLPQTIGPQLLQVGHLAGTEEDFGPAELVLVRVLGRRLSNE